VLSETEIQERLYGSYRGQRRAAPFPRPAPVSPNAEWSGKEILSGELQRLRSELILLRDEKDRLARQIARLVPTGPGERVWVAPPSVHRNRWPLRLAAVLAAVGLVGYWMGGRILQASPMAGEAAPYTIQAAVYDVPTPARLAVEFLAGLSYDAFLVELPRRKDGKTRWRVCVGSFVTRQEANREKLRLLGDPRFPHFKDAFVRVR